MVFLKKSDITRRPVVSRRMLHPGGAVGPGSYERRIKNIVVSPGLINRITKDVPRAMMACEKPDHCVPLNKPELVGRLAPDGKPYKQCSVEERITRLQEALACAKRNLAGGGALHAERIPVRKGRARQILEELGL
jgi:hypothetical protein